MQDIPEGDAGVAETQRRLVTLAFRRSDMMAVRLRRIAHGATLVGMKSGTGRGREPSVPPPMHRSRYSVRHGVTPCRCRTLPVVNPLPGCTPTNFSASLGLQPGLKEFKSGIPIYEFGCQLRNIGHDRSAMMGEIRSWRLQDANLLIGMYYMDRNAADDVDRDFFHRSVRCLGTMF